MQAYTNIRCPLSNADFDEIDPDRRVKLEFDNDTRWFFHGPSLVRWMFEMKAPCVPGTSIPFTNAQRRAVGVMFDVRSMAEDVPVHIPEEAKFLADSGVDVRGAHLKAREFISAFPDRAKPTPTQVRASMVSLQHATLEEVRAKLKYTGLDLQDDQISMFLALMKDSQTREQIAESVNIMSQQ